MSDKDLETRFVSLEHEVGRLREDTASARALAGPDVAEFRTQLRGHHHVLSALRETQLEQGGGIEKQSQLIEEQGRLIEGHGRLIDGHGRMIEEQGQEMREGFATMSTGMAQITALLTTIAGTESGSDSRREP